MNQCELVLRDYKDADFESMNALTTELGYPTSDLQMKLRMDIICAHKDYKTIVAVCNEDLIGYIGLFRGYFWEKDSFHVRVQALVVKKCFRRLSVGSSLLNEAENWGKEIGANAILLNCGDREERESAHIFYKRKGFLAKSIGYFKEISV